MIEETTPTPKQSSDLIADSQSKYECLPRKETLCWTCNHSLCTPSPVFNKLEMKLPTGRIVPCHACPWAFSYKPVPGWTATPTKLNAEGGVVLDSFNVKSCPYYDPDYEGKALALTKQQLAELLGVHPKAARALTKLCSVLAAKYFRALDELKEVGMDLDPRKPAAKYKICRAIALQHLEETKWNIEQIYTEGDPNNFVDKADVEMYQAEYEQCVEFLRYLDEGREKLVKTGTSLPRRGRPPKK